MSSRKNEEHDRRRHMKLYPLRDGWEDREIRVKPAFFSDIDWNAKVEMPQIVYREPALNFVIYNYDKPCHECHGTGFADENRPCEHP